MDVKEAEKIKEAFIRVCESAKEYRQNASEKKKNAKIQNEYYTLPDGNQIAIPVKLSVTLGEAIFHPNLISIDDIGIAESTSDCVSENVHFKIYLNLNLKFRWIMS